MLTAILSHSFRLRGGVSVVEVSCGSSSSNAFSSSFASTSSTFEFVIALDFVIVDVDLEHMTKILCLHVLHACAFHVNGSSLALLTYCNYDICTLCVLKCCSPLALRGRKTMEADSAWNTAGRNDGRRPV